MQSVCLTPLIKGALTGAALIIAIGAQNAFVLKQGILKNHVFVIALLCSILDAVLIFLGVAGIGNILASHPLLLEIARWGGMAFLVYYGARSFYAVFKEESLQLESGHRRPNLKKTVLTVLALSLLNPHAFLDACVLLGSIGAQFHVTQRPYFALGAIISSFVWFFSIAYAARYLGPLFKKPIAWKILDFFVGIVMWSIAISLYFYQPVVCAF